MRPSRPLLQQRRSLAVAALLAVAPLLPGCGVPGSAQPIDPVELQWGDEPNDGAWKPLHPGDAIDREGHGEREPVWFRVQVPACAEPDPALGLRIGLGTKLEEMRVGDARIAIADRVPILPLPKANVPVLLRARLTLTSAVPAIAVGSQRAFWSAGVRRELPELLVAGTLLVAGLLLLSTTLRRGSAKAFRGLGLFLFLMGVLSLGELRLMRTLVFPSDMFSYFVYETAGYLLPFGLGAFVIAIFGDTRRKLLGRGARGYAVFVPLAWAGVLAFAPARRLDELRAVSNTFILFQAVTAVALAVSRVRSGDRAARAFLYGFALLLLISLPDILDGMGFFTLYFQTVPYAALAFGAAMTVVTERRMAETRDALAVSAGELSRKVLALEEKNREVVGLNSELRHQIAERSRELASAVRTGIAAQRSGTALREGDVVGGRYRVIGALGSGGMGAVHEVERVSDGKRFALKVMSGAPHPTTAARFAREAEIAARIVDPHLVPVVDVSGSTSDRLYLVMELVHGRSLEQARARFGDVAWGIEVLAQIAEGLAALHAAGVVHRDLKPGNVLLARREDGAEIAKISDFGISRFGAHEDDDPSDDLSLSPGVGEADTLDPPATLWAAETEARPAPTSAPASAPRPLPLTATGVVMGTPAYMAPELRGGARLAKPASDVFAFGLIAYEVLAGRPAWSAPPIQLALANEHLPEIAKLPDAVPADLSARILACLDEAPSRRPSIAEVIAVLEHARR